MLKIAYFGSPKFSADFLEKILTDNDLKKNIKVEFVVTQPDRLAGRKQLLTPTAVKKISLKYQLPVYEIDNLKDKNSLEVKNLKLKINNLDFALVYAYSSIIPLEILHLPKYGFWCLHPSLLPKYRGPSPIAYPLILGDEKTGVTIFKMDEKIDHGPIIAQKSLTIADNDFRTDLEKKLTKISFEMFKSVILNLSLDKNIGLNPLADPKCSPNKFGIRLIPQNHSQATYTRLLKKSDGFIPFLVLKKVLAGQPLSKEEIPLIIKEYWEKNNQKNEKNSSLLIFNLFRGLYPWPGLWTILPNDKRLKIIHMSIKDKKLAINKIQLEGKKPVDFSTFNRAYQMF